MRPLSALALALSASVLLACPVIEPDPESDPQIAGSEHTVTFEASDGVQLEGTLQLPRRSEGEAVPAVVFAHGSGPQNRDSALALNYFQVQQPVEVKVFEDLADILADAGYASLRYDKRSCGPFNGLCENDYPVPAADINVSDFLDDARSALEFLGAHADIDGDRLALAGHSQGGAFPPLLLDDVVGLQAGVLLAGPYRGIEVLLAWQRDLQRALLIEAGLSEAQADAQLASLSQLVDDLFDLRDAPYDGDTLSAADQAFWQDWFDVGDDAVTRAATVTQPMLALSGELDMNVPPEDTDLWGELFQTAASAPRSEAMVLPCLTHALNCQREPDFFQVEAADVDAFVSPNLGDEVVAFLDASL